MNIYNEEYFFIRKPKYDDKIPSPVPDKNTENRIFSFDENQNFSAPFVFHNGWKEENINNKIKSITPNILFAGSDLLVRTLVKEKLNQISLPNLYIHPAIYVDDNDKWHEDYWYITSATEFDCWDRDDSEYDQDTPPIKIGEKELHQVYTYSLNINSIEKTPLQERLLFKMGSTLMDLFVCHKNLYPIFHGGGTSGAELVPIKDY